MGNKMKKTNYVMLVGWSMSNKETYRRVWEMDGKYFVKVDGEIRDVTKMSNNFIKD